MTVRYIAATEYLMGQLHEGGSSSTTIQMSELAVSAVSFEWIMADVEQDPDVPPAERNQWRTNIANFRKTLVQSGGEVPALTEGALSQWGKALLLDLTHDYGEGPQEMDIEERLVIATAADLGLIYLAPPRDWNDTLRDKFGLALMEA